MTFLVWLGFILFLPQNCLDFWDHHTQSNLVASILKTKYNIPSYTYAKAHLQQFWHDTRFKKNAPKYVVILGQDYEFTYSPWIETLLDTNDNLSMTAWTKESWWQVHESREKKKLFHVIYSYTSDYEKRYSILRVISYKMFRALVNSLFTRSELVDIFSSGANTYDPESNFIFSSSELENPALGSPYKTKKDFEQAVTILKTSNALLKKRGITLIVGVMPTKSYLYSKTYRNFPKDKPAIAYFDKAIDNAGIARIPLFETVYDASRTSGQPFYYPQDSHWSARTNKVIADLLYQKIQELSPLLLCSEARPLTRTNL